MRHIREKTIGVTAFKARCLGLVEEVASGKTGRVVLTRRGKPVAELTGSKAEAMKRQPSSFGALKHMKFDESVDLTAPMDIQLDAEKGILFNE